MESDMDMDVDPVPLSTAVIRPPRPIHPRTVIAPPRPISSNSGTTSRQRLFNVNDPIQRPSSVPLRRPSYTVGYIYSVDMTLHSHLRSHPECPERITEIWEAVVEAQYDKRMKRLPIRQVTREEALLVHSEALWDRTLFFQHMSPEDVADSDHYFDLLSLYVTTGTTLAARLSCGGVIEACLAVARGELKKTLAIVRPPGHHAEPDDSMGFCFFNNVAVAARVLQETTSVRKILILDWDVHHGNGTQKAFYDDPSVLYISLHRYEDGDFYPCTTYGSMHNCGDGPGLGYSVNIPWPEGGMRDADYIHAFQRIVMPIAVEFAPELVIISAGFDAAEGDDLGECHVSPAGYANMTHMLAGLAGGRLVVALEGGYNLDSIKASALAVTSVLLGESPAPLDSMVASPAASETVWLVAREQSKYWRNLDPKACEPRTGLEKISFSIPGAHMYIREIPQFDPNQYYSVAEILKAHRQHHMYTQHDMLELPLPTDDLGARFSSQVMCSNDLFDSNTLVVFVHEFGNLRAEITNSPTCNVNQERSYLIDFSQQLIAWVKSEGYSLLDINLYPKPAPRPASAPRSKIPQDTDYGKKVLKYLWDNYVQLSSAQQVVLIGHGPGCRQISQLLLKRSAGVMQCVKAIVQVAGHSYTPRGPKLSDEMDSWYAGCSCVVLPSTHTMLGPQTGPTYIRDHGQVLAIEESQVVKLISRALPSIQAFVNGKLPSRNPTSLNGNDHR